MHNLPDQVKNLQERALSILERAEESGDLRTALTAIRESKSCIELLAKMHGQLQQEGTTNVTVQMQARYDLTQRIIRSPDAREQVAEEWRRQLQIPLVGPAIRQLRVRVEPGHWLDRHYGTQNRLSRPFPDPVPYPTHPTAYDPRKLLATANRPFTPCGRRRPLRVPSSRPPVWCL